MELDSCPRAARIGRRHRCQPRAGLSQNRLEEAMDTPNGALVRRCFRHLNARTLGPSNHRITLADITEEEFRVLSTGDRAFRHAGQVKLGTGQRKFALGSPFPSADVSLISGELRLLVAD